MAMVPGSTFQMMEQEEADRAAARQATVAAFESRIVELERRLEERAEFVLEGGKADIARIIEAHECFDCPAGTTYAKAAGLIANSIVASLGRTGPRA